MQSLNVQDLVTQVLQTAAEAGTMPQIGAPDLLSCCNIDGHSLPPSVSVYSASSGTKTDPGLLEKCFALLHLANRIESKASQIGRLEVSPGMPFSTKAHESWS